MRREFIKFETSLKYPVRRLNQEHSHNRKSLTRMRTRILYTVLKVCTVLPVCPPPPGPALTSREDAVRPHVPANFCSDLESINFATSIVFGLVAYVAYTSHEFIDLLVVFDISTAFHDARPTARIMAATVRAGRALRCMPPTPSSYPAVRIQSGRRSLCTGAQLYLSTSRLTGFRSIASSRSGACLSTTHGATVCRPQRAFPARYVAGQRRTLATVKHGKLDELAKWSSEY